MAELADAVRTTPFDRQITASKAGILLESILDNLCLRYRCRVARSADSSYTLGELLDATTALFKKAEVRRPALEPTGQPMNPPQFTTSKPDDVLGKLRALAFIRNQVGAHFNVSGLEIADSDVEGFADLTVQFADALSCPRCGQIPSRDAETHFECSCPSTMAVQMSPIRVS